MKLHPRRGVTLWESGDPPPQCRCLECGRGFFMAPTFIGRPYVTCSDPCSLRRNRMLDRTRWARSGAVGFLHELHCGGEHYRPRKSCRPIPVYSKKQDVAA